MSPILTENRIRYPKDWKLRSRFVRLYRARNRCEWCGARNGDPRPCVLRAWFAGQKSWIEFRGPAYRVWSDRNESPAQKLHDALEGWHTCVLHAGDTLTVLDRHPDYERVRGLMEE